MGRTSGGRRGLRRFRAGRHAGVGGRNLSRHALAGLRAVYFHTKRGSERSQGG
jgi:hypothetical protein